MELVRAPAHPSPLRPELPRERGGQREVGVEHVQGAAGVRAQPHVRADPRLLPILPALHVVVRDVLGRLDVVRVDLQPPPVHQDREAGGVDRDVPELVHVGAEVIALVRRGLAARGERALHLRHERLELRLVLAAVPPFAAERDPGAERDGLDLLQAHEIRGGREARELGGDAPLRDPRAREPLQRVAEVAHVVADDPQRRGRHDLDDSARGPALPALARDGARGRIRSRRRRRCPAARSIRPGSSTGTAGGIPRRRRSRAPG